MIVTLAAIALSAYLLELLLLGIGLARSRRMHPQRGYEPTVSVIVAARNEEAFIERCISSLLHLDYPREKLEFVIVNDGSTDRTKELIDDLARRDPRIRTISTTPGSGNLRGKTNAVAGGINASSGEILLFTDADCVVSPGWVRSTVAYFDERTGAVGGFTLLDAGGAFGGIQALDWVFLFGIASAAAGWNIPLTAVGNNLAVRRSAYLGTGGYAAIPFSVTEDYALVRAILRRTDYRVRFPLDPSTVVRSSPCQTWEQLYRQKQRWSVGGLDMVFYGMLIMAIGWLARAGIVMTLLTSGWGAGAIFLGVLALADLALLIRPLRLFRETRTLRYFPAFELYLFVTVLVIPIVALLSRKVVWKERTL